MKIDGMNVRTEYISSLTDKVQLIIRKRGKQMIEEQYVSFETAKLAKEKGFDIPTRYGFSERRSLVRVDTSDNWNQDKELYSRPTQSLLARWLREIHNMCVEVYSTGYGFIWCICDTDSGPDRPFSN